MTTEAVDYANVLADLKARRDKLNSAIEAIELIIGSGVTITRDAGAFVSTISSDSFFGMQLLEAVVKYLGIAKKPKTATEIAEALTDGGYTHRSKQLAATVYTTLKRAEERGADVVKVGKAWGLAEWYPGRPRIKAMAPATKTYLANQFPGAGMTDVGDDDEDEGATSETDDGQPIGREQHS